MTRKHSAIEALNAADADVSDIKRWGYVLVAMGASDSHIHPGAAFVIGQAIEALGRRVEEQWDIAHAAVRDTEGGR